MELTEDQFTKLEEMSAALMPPADIAILLDIPHDQQELFVQICKGHHHEKIYQIYQRGRLTTKFALRQTTIKLAKAGSPAAEPIAQRFIHDQNNSE